MKVIEIFESIDGEGKYAGWLATFIRLAGCNLRCSYCDTAYSFTGGNDMAVSDIVERAEQLGNKHITLTGGEPLIHNNVKELIEALYRHGYIVNIETNGSVNISEYLDMPIVITLDYKTISSGMNKCMLLDNIKKLRPCDVLKIVCCEDDFDDIRQLLKTTTISAPVYLSPIYGKITPAKLVEFSKKLKDEKIADVRIQVQLHKIIWHPDERGV